MPVNYKNGKIYKLFSYDNDLVYVGSTTQPLSKRLGEHKGKCNKSCSKILFENSNNVKIQLLEEIECDNIEQLRRLEGEYIRRLDCVNKRIAGRTEKEHYEENKEKIIEQNKKYYEKNKEHRKEQMKEYNKEWMEKNKEQVKEYHKEYYEDNKEHIKEYSKKLYEKNKEKKKEYRENNKEQIKEYQKEYRDKKRKEKLAFANRASTTLPGNSTSDVGIVATTS